MLEPFVRPEKRSVLFVGSVTIASRPWSILPEPRVGLLVTEQVMVVMVYIRGMAGKVIRRLESQMRPAETGAR